MVQVVKSVERGRTIIDWLDSYHSFSFGEYHNSNNISFGPLRVLNDDTVIPGAGFSTHPHRDMEIITIVTHGTIAHRDSSGGEGIIRVGEIQKMSAGKGILHSEFNASDKEILKFYQIWIIPNQIGLKPSYEEFRYSEEELLNKLHLVASGDKTDGVIFINQDAKIYLADFDVDMKYNFTTSKERGVYIHIISGSLEVNEHELKSGDACKVKGVDSITLMGKENSRFLLFDLEMPNK
jgi:quercetin 2,3-dioxygenase